MPKYLLLLLLLALTACGSGESENNSNSDIDLVIPEGEDLEIIPPSSIFSKEMLMTHYIEDASTLPEKERNVIIEYAISKKLPLIASTTGLFYQVLESGAVDDPVAWGDLLKAHYQGKFLDGKVFDDTKKRDAPMQFYVGNTIQGWNEGLQNIGPGGKVRLLVPSHMAYGEEGLKGKNDKVLVPPNTILDFEIEVLERLGRTEYD